MKRGRTFGRRHARGFTLIEVLLATVLLAAGLALAFATLRATTATVQRGETIAQRNEHMRAVELFLRRRISGARPAQFGMNPDTAVPRRFEGDRSHMRFVADLPDYLGRGGPYMHELTISDTPDGGQLDVAFTLVLAGELSPEATPRPPEVLATKLRSAAFRYRAMKADNTLDIWQEEWKTGDRLPVQVEVTLQDADGRNWPPMIVALPLAGGYQGMGQ